MVAIPRTDYRLPLARWFVGQRDERSPSLIDVGDPSAISLAHHNIGVVQLALDHPDSARTELQLATRIADETGDQRLMARNLIGLSGVDRALGQHVSAERSATRALTVARAMGSRELVRQAWEALSAAQAGAGHLGAALNSYQ